MIAKEDVIEVLRTIEDPELFLDIWFLGLVYDIDIEDDNVRIEMTFTSPMCPMGRQIVEEIKDKVGRLEGIKKVDVQVVFTPPWKPSEEVRLTLGLM